MLYKEQMDSVPHTGLDSAINVQRAHVVMAKLEVLKTLQNINRSRARRGDYALDALSLQLGAFSSFVGAGLEITGHQNGGAPMAVGVALLGTTLCHCRSNRLFEKQNIDPHCPKRCHDNKSFCAR